MSVPAALGALETVWRSALTAAGLADVQVFDGPDANRKMAPKSVTVGVPFLEDDQDAVLVTTEERGAALQRIQSIDVACSLYVGSGDVDLDSHRDDAGAILLVLDDAIRANRTLNGTVSLARLVSAQWMQGRDDAGTGVAVGMLVNMRRLP